MSRIVRFTSQKIILKYLNEEFMIKDNQMSRGERKIMDKLVDNGKVIASYHNVGLWSSKGRSWIEYRLKDQILEKTNLDELFTEEDYEK